MLNIAICDDDAATLDYLGKMVVDLYHDDCNVSKHKNGYALELYVEEVLHGALDLLIIDVDLNTHNGIIVSKKLKEVYPQIKVIFISGNISYSCDIFEAGPTYFLLKPIQEDRLIRALEAANRVIENDEQNAITFQSKGCVYRLQYNEIDYIESNRRTVVIHETSGIRTIYSKLDEVESRLPPCFIRCHQSYIVNMARIKRMNTNSFILNNGEEIPISQLKYKTVKSRFLQYVGDSL